MKVLLTAVEPDSAPGGGSRVIYNSKSGKIYGLIRIAPQMPGVSENDAYLDFREPPEVVAPMIQNGAFVKGSYICAGWEPSPSRQVYSANNLMSRSVRIKAPASSAESVLIEYYSVDSFDATGILVGHYYAQLDENREVEVKLTGEYMKQSGLYLVRIWHSEFGKLTLKVDMVVSDKKALNDLKNPVQNLTDPEKLVESVKDTDAYKSVLNAAGKTGKDMSSTIGKLFEDSLLSGKPFDENKLAEELKAKVQEVGKIVEEATQNENQDQD